jgi:hypothetical protein
VCCCCVDLKSILGVGPKVNDSIEDPFKQETWLGDIGVGLHVRVQGTTTVLLFLASFWTKSLVCVKML